MVMCILAKLRSGDDHAINATVPTHVTLNSLNHSMEKYILPWERVGTGLKKQAKDSMLDFAFTFSLKLVYCVLNRFMVCIEWAFLVYCVGAFYVLGGCFS